MHILNCGFQAGTSFPDCLADGLNAANGQQNLLLTTLGSQLANGANTAAGNALTTALQFNQLGLLNLSPVVLVSNLNEAVSLFRI